MFTATDAIILYTLFSPASDEPAVRVKEMISFADYINHDILTYDEISEAFGRLQANDLIVITRHSLKVTPLCLRWRTTLLKKKKVSIYKELKEIESSLNLSFTVAAEEEKEWLEKSVYELAVKNYLTKGDH